MAIRLSCFTAWRRHMISSKTQSYSFLSVTTVSKVELGEVVVSLMLCHADRLLLFLSPHLREQSWYVSLYILWRGLWTTSMPQINGHQDEALMFSLQTNPCLNPRSLAIWGLGVPISVAIWAWGAPYCTYMHRYLISGFYGILSLTMHIIP